MDEQGAIKLCIKHRDPVGFEFLVRRYRREAFHHAYGLLGNQEEALDACQESFAKAFAAIPRLESLAAFYPWFYRILRNRCLNLLARSKTAAAYRETAPQRASGLPEPSDPATILERQEEHQRVRQVLQRLAPEHREVLAMKYIQGQSYEEMARILGLPRGTIMSRLYYARTAFRRRYQNEAGLSDRPKTKTENAT